LDRINKDFESLNNFKKKFEDVAQKRFGSGWVWLVLTKSGRLKVMSTANQDNPLMNVIRRGGYPLLGLDLWEHAYYLKYQNKRDEYIKGFWDFVNWEFVNKMYEMKTKTTLNENYFKRIILESTSEKCSPVQNNFYRQLFNNNQHIKNQFNEKIEEVFSQVFPDNYYRRNEYKPGTLRGLYDFMGEPGRSSLNRVNTNYTCFCILVNDINKVILTLRKRPINFQEGNIDYEMSRFLGAITYFKDRIFNPNSSTFKALVDIVKKTGGFGEQNENYVVKKLKEKLGDENVRKVADIGNLDDTLKGIDCELIYDGRRYAAQIKPFISIVDTEDNKVKIIGGGGVKKYNTDLLIFTNRKEIYVFKNINTDIEDGDFLIPSKDLVFKLD